MLIVVAIIAILVAVSIPMINNSLERARIATDAANERAAKAEAIIMYLNEDTLFDGFKTSDDDISADYDASAGKLVTTGSLTDATKHYGKCTDHKGQYIVVTIKKTGDVTVDWSSTKNKAHSGIVGDS